MKTCTKCGRSRRRDAFRKYWGRSSDGLRPICRDCQKLYERHWRLRHKADRKRARIRRSEKERIYRKEYDARNRGRLLIMETKRRCKKRGMPFDLLDHVEEIEARVQAGQCELTKISFDFHAKGIQWNSPSIDRIRPDLGYTYRNIRVICFGMNAALGSWGEAVLRKIVEGWLGGKS